ncbi:ArsR family transcriptional regulator [Rhodospirillaceae bacterium RKSG073]|nr:ArsR family transcriptional regulator [Curvivirga aplysinae]
MSNNLDEVFMALSDQTRRDLVHSLAEKEQTISELAAPYDMSLAAVSKHLKILEKAGLLRRRVDGRTHYCSLRPEALGHALDWISIYRRFWNDKLDVLDNILTHPSKENENA